MKWYQQSCINKRDYILENLEKFNMTHEEVILLLLIDYMNQNHLIITHETLSKKMNLSKGQIDELLNVLMEKTYLGIDIVNGGMVYTIDGVFDSMDQQSFIFSQSLFEFFEECFKRTLSQNEMQRLSDWMQVYDHDLIRYALREALTYNSLSFEYIDRILMRWQEDGFTARQYEKEHGE